jgi:energy-coupling factor transport system ATP-binding protein
MIVFEHVSVTYPGAEMPVLREVTLSLAEGELCLVVGRTGVGKSTLLGAIDGLVPHFTGGLLEGRVLVDGRDTATHRPKELADIVGVVGQDPTAGFTTDTVEEELAYGMEQMAVPPDVMRKRVEETLDLMGLADIRDAPLHEISGGQQQRVAIGSVLTAHPKVLLLDEPTSSLDPTAAEEVLATITRLVHDLGVTVVLAEHRLERVAQYADRVLEVRADGSVVDGAPAQVLGVADVAPPVVELGRLAGWQPLPLSVRDARRAAASLRDRLAAVDTPRRIPAATRRSIAASARKIVVQYGDLVAVREVTLDLYEGETVALMGRNGAGKSSLLWALQGSGARQGGTVDVSGEDPRNLQAARRRGLVGLVPQNPTDLLYLETVSDELAQADRESHADAGAARRQLDRLAAGLDGWLHPRDLSEGQRLALVLAVQLSAAPGVVLLDEPTRGLDYRGKDALRAMLGVLTAESRAVVVCTHDVEFAAACADRVVVMAEGSVVADGPADAILAGSPAFAPQVAKIVAPLPYLTVAEVRAALDGAQ